MEAELRDGVEKLEHVKWIRDNLTKYEGEMKQQKADQLLENIEKGDDKGIRRAYKEFVENFLQNPYMYVCQTKNYDREKIVSRYPKCYFVKREGEYVPVGFLMELKEKDNGKLTKAEKERLLWKDLRKAKNTFWIKECSEKERIYLEYGYDCYVDKWKKPGKNMEGKVHAHPEKREKKLPYMIWLILFLIVYIRAMFLGQLEVYKRFERGDEWLYYEIMVSGTVLVLLLLVLLYLWHKWRLYLYKEAKRKYEEEWIFEQCCDEVYNAFLVKDDEPLCVKMDAEDWQIWEKNLKGIKGIKNKNSGEVKVRGKLRYGVFFKEKEYLLIIMQAIAIFQAYIYFLLF